MLSSSPPAVPPLISGFPPFAAIPTHHLSEHAAHPQPRQWCSWTRPGHSSPAYIRKQPFPNRDGNMPGRHKSVWPSALRQCSAWPPPRAPCSSGRPSWKTGDSYQSCKEIASRPGIAFHCHRQRIFCMSLYISSPPSRPFSPPSIKS